MSTRSKPRHIKHIELGKTLVSENLHFEAFDHFKKSIALNNDIAIDILTYLYKKQFPNDSDPDILLIIAKIYIEINMPNEAFDVIEDILTKNISHEATYETLSKLLPKKTLTAKIKYWFELAIENKIFFPSIIQILPKLYLEEKNYTKAIHLYHQLIAIQPKEYSYYKILSELHFRKRDYAAASDILHQLIKIAPFKSEELLKPIEQIIYKIPRNAAIRMLYASVLFRAFKPAEGCNEVETLVKYHPNQINAAIKLLKSQNEAFPQTPDILYLISELMIQAELYTDSLSYIQTIIELSSSHYDHCLMLMQKIIQFYPNHVMALEIIGTIYYKQHNYLQAFHYFKHCILECDTPTDLTFIEDIKAIQNNPNEPTQNKAKLLIAHIHTKMKQFDLAMSVIDELISTEEDIDASLLKVSIFNQNNRSLDALQLLQSLSKSHPFNSNIYATYQDTFNLHTQHNIQARTNNVMDSYDYIELSSYYLSKNNLTPAIESLQKVDQHSEHYNTAQQMIARCFFEQSRFDLADQIYSRIIKQTQSHAIIKECLYWKGLAQLLLSNDSEALQSFETITTYDQHYLSTPNLIEHLRKTKFLNHHGLILVQSNSGNPPKLALRKNHFSPQKKQSHQFEVIGFSQSYNDEGCKQIIKQQFRAGKESLKLAIQMDPKFHVAYLNLAVIDLMESKPNDALEKISLAEAITNKCPYLFFIKATCHAQKNNLESAIRSIQQALKLYSNDGIFYLVLGDLFFNQGNIEIALNYWKKSRQTIEYTHWEQHRHRATHFDKISIDYWTSPEFLTLR